MVGANSKTYSPTITDDTSFRFVPDKVPPAEALLNIPPPDRRLGMLDHETPRSDAGRDGDGGGFFLQEGRLTPHHNFGGVARGFFAWNLGRATEEPPSIFIEVDGGFVL